MHNNRNACVHMLQREEGLVADDKLHHLCNALKTLLELQVLGIGLTREKVKRTCIAKLVPADHLEWNKTNLWIEESTTQALATYDEGMSMHVVARIHGIPYSTFREWCYGVRKKGLQLF